MPTVTEVAHDYVLSLIPEFLGSAGGLSSLRAIADSLAKARATGHEEGVGVFSAAPNPYREVPVGGG